VGSEGTLTDKGRPRPFSCALRAEEGKLFAVANDYKIHGGNKLRKPMSRAIGYSVGLVVFVDAFRRGWKLVQVRTQLQDLEAQLRAVDWSYANRLRTQLQDLEARLRAVDSSYADRVRTQRQDLEARLRSVDWSYANLIHTPRDGRSVAR
jgi:uncharacterized protein YqcC (DUF446 family)